MHFQYSFALMLFVAVAALADETTKPVPSTNAVSVDPEVLTTDEHKKTTTTMKPTTSQEPTTSPATTNATASPTTPTNPPTSPTTHSPPTTTPATTTPATTTPATTTPATTTPATTTPATTTPATTPPPTVAPTTPAPTPAPKPAEAWVVKGENGTVCIIAAMVVKITVPYKSANTNKTVNAEFDLENVANATATGQCGKVEQTLILTWENITSTFRFSHNKDNSSYLLKSIEVDIVVNNRTFPNNTMVNATKVALTYDAQVFKVPVNHSYTCSSVNPLSLNGTSYNGTTHLNGTFSSTLTLTKVHVEAFGLGKDDKYSAPMDCSPFETPDIVPIVVGLVLAGLVVVVLIAYLVGRRRAQARGYLSM